MSIYHYQAKTAQGETRDGSIESPSMEIAVGSLQRMGLVIISLVPAEESHSIWEKSFGIKKKVKLRDVVILSRQLSTLFSAKVPVLSSFKVLSAESSSLALRRHLDDVISDIQGGLSMSAAMEKHPEVFSSFYVNMVRSGEESGKLEQIFSYLADYLDRSYELQSKVRNAMIYPAFVLSVFIIVMSLMLVVVIPKLASIIVDSGAQLPIYTQIVLGFSSFLQHFGILILLLLGVGGFMSWRYTRTPVGAMAYSRFTINIPIIGELYRKLYLARIADNLNTLLSGGVAVLRALEITSDVVGNEVYANIMRQAINEVKSGSRISEALSRFEEMPSLFVQMVRVGEETGKLDFILETLAKFYKREVDNVVDNLVSLIEPAMIILLGLGVGILVAAVLLPIYNISSSI